MTEETDLGADETAQPSRAERRQAAREQRKLKRAERKYWRGEESQIKRRRRRGLYVAGGVVAVAAIAAGVWFAAVQGSEEGVSTDAGVVESGSEAVPITEERDAEYGSGIELGSGTTAAISVPEVVGETSDGTPIIAFDVTVENGSDMPLAFAGISVILPNGSTQLYLPEYGSSDRLGSIAAGDSATWTVTASSHVEPEKLEVGIRTSPTDPSVATFGGE